jgi:hypothetical protein
MIKTIYPTKKQTYKMVTTKKSLYIEPIASMLRIWNAHEWIEYDELEVSGKQKAKGIFKEIIFKMDEKFCYNFPLTEIEYKNWRKAKPSFIKGQ